MALSTTVHDLRTLIRSSHPLVVIETVEEERMPLFEWSITRGELTRAEEVPTLSRLTAAPLAVLQHLHGLTVESGRSSIWKIYLGLRNQDSNQFDLDTIVDASDGFSGSEIEQAVVTVLYRALHQKTPLTTGRLSEELPDTTPRSVTRREDIDAPSHTAEGRFVNVWE